MTKKCNNQRLWLSFQINEIQQEGGAGQAFANGLTPPKHSHTQPDSQRYICEKLLTKNEFQKKKKEEDEEDKGNGRAKIVLFNDKRI